MMSSRKVGDQRLTDIGRRGLGPWLHWAVELASVPVAERGVLGGCRWRVPVLLVLNWSGLRWRGHEQTNQAHVTGAWAHARMHLSI
jgi:hypothetical protein